MLQETPPPQITDAHSAGGSPRECGIAGFLEKSKNLRKADEEDEEEEEVEEEEEEDDDSPSTSEVERSSAQSSKAHALRKQVQQEELTLRQWEERLAELKKKNAKRSRAFVELQISKTAKTSMERRKISNQLLYNQSALAARFEK